MDHGAQDDVDGSLHAASVIRALRKKRAAVVNNTPLPDAQTVPLNPHNSHEREDNYLGGAGSPGAQTGARGTGGVSDLAEFNEIVRSTKRNGPVGGRTEAGVEYSAEELEFYRDHLTGLKASPDRRPPRQREHVLQQQPPKKSMPLWMRGSVAASARAARGEKANKGNDDEDEWLSDDDEDDTYTGSVDHERRRNRSGVRSSSSSSSSSSSPGQRGGYDEYGSSSLESELLRGQEEAQSFRLPASGGGGGGKAEDDHLPRKTHSDGKKDYAQQQRLQQKKRVASEAKSLRGRESRDPRRSATSAADDDSDWSDDGSLADGSSRAMGDTFVDYDFGFGGVADDEEAAAMEAAMAAMMDSLEQPTRQTQHNAMSAPKGGVRGSRNEGFLRRQDEAKAPTSDYRSEAKGEPWALPAGGRGTSRVEEDDGVNDDDEWDVEAEYQSRLAAVRERENQQPEDRGSPHQCKRTDYMATASRAAPHAAKPHSQNRAADEGSSSRHRGGGSAGGSAFKTLEMKPGQRLRVRPQPRRTRA